VSGPTYRRYRDALSPRARRLWFAWLASRPPEIRELAEAKPPGSWTMMGGRKAHLVSYALSTVGPGYHFSFTDPAVDYDAAVATRFFVCADCLDHEDHV
jgi:hypothetical protein